MHHSCLQNSKVPKTAQLQMRQEVRGWKSPEPRELHCLRDGFTRAKGGLFFFFFRFILVFAAILPNLLICYMLLIRRMGSESCPQPWVETWSSELAGRSEVYYLAGVLTYYNFSFKSQPTRDCQSPRHKMFHRSDVCSKI